MTKKHLLAAVAVCLAALLIVALMTDFLSRNPSGGVLKVGFIYSEDESTPYTYNFVQGQRALTDEFGSKVQVIARSNVNAREAEEPIRELVRAGCRIIFINLDTDAAVHLCGDYPEVQFCQVSLPTVSMEGLPKNYHTFNGEVYQARYVSGVIAGMKLRALIDGDTILARNAKVGYVAANDSPEVISGYTAFILGVHSVAPEAVLRVRYTGSWSNYSMEKEKTKELIDEGCVIIAQHTNTMAPAIACEEAYENGYRVYHVGYHQSMMDVAPSTALVSLRTNWVPYMLGAAEAVMKNEIIEKHVNGHVHGNDISAGFDHDWVQILELNTHLAAPGTAEKMNRTIEALCKGRIDVFRGSYVGYDPHDPTDTIDLSMGFQENENSSSPSFHYILKECVIIEN